MNKVLPVIIMALVVFMGSALSVFAATHHYTCSDTLTLISTPCTSTDVFTFTANSSQWYDDTVKYLGAVPNGTVLYFNAVYSGTGGFTYGSTGNLNFTVANGSGTLIDAPITVGGGDDSGTGNYPIFIDTAAYGGTHTFNGTLSSICVSTSIGDCAGGGGGGSGATGATSAATSSVDQIQDNLYHGFIVLFFAMVFPIWFFGRRR